MLANRQCFAMERLCLVKHALILQHGGEVAHDPRYSRVTGRQSFPKYRKRLAEKQFSLGQLVLGMEEYCKIV
jgi:hypothetical protein